MATCKNCGCVMPADNLYCTQCGTKLEVTIQQNKGARHVPGRMSVPGSKSEKKYSGTIAAAVILILCALGLLGGLGVYFLGGYGDSALGSYEARRCWQDGAAVELNGESLLLSPWGKGELNLDGKTSQVTWKLTDGRITVTRKNNAYKGTLEKGVLKVKISGREFDFAREGASYTPENQKAIDWWNRDFYGWWIIRKGTGIYEEEKGRFYDACARVTVSPDGTGTMQIWDVNCEAGDFLAEADILMKNGMTANGGILSASGQFKSEALDPKEWSADPGNTTDIGNITQMISITGNFDDPKNPGSGYTYTVFLRPWGLDWEDVRGEREDSAYRDMMPKHYESWYLPLIQSGVDRAPEVMDVK